jgi:tripartite ATP-independent transporter DctM subunit
MSLALTLMFVFMVITSLLGMPIGLSLISSGMIYLMVSGRDVGLAAEQTLNGTWSTFIILAVPLFIFAARVMNAGSITDRLLNVALLFVGRLRGGLAHVNIVASVIFSGMSGSAVADASGMGYVLVKMMTKGKRYPPGYANAITATSSTIGPIIPPSIPMILYALVSGTSIGALFLGGVIPGLAMALALAVVVWWSARARGFPREDAVPWRQVPGHLLRGILPMLTPAILLGGIYSGAFTPTEAAAIAGLYALLLTVFVYREQGLKELYAVLKDTAVASAVAMLVVAGAFIFNYAVTVEQVPARIAAALGALEMSAIGFNLFLMVIFLLLGAFFTTTTILLVVVPLVLPAVQLYGIDLVHFGVVVVVNAMIGLVTPPYGVLLFILSGLTDTPVGAIIKESWRFMGALIVALIVMVVWPDMVLWLPRRFGY